MNPRDILIRPLWTEKTTLLREEQNQVAFVVRQDATKIQVRQAIQQIFGVKVLHVRVVRQRGKAKRVGRHQGYRADWKKAYVKLAEGAKIEFFEGV